MTNQELACKILESVGGRSNVTGVINCMTRMRINLRDYSKVSIEGLNTLDGVLQVIQMENLHIVLGPGKARKITDRFREQAGIAPVSTGDNWERNKAAVKSSQSQSTVKTALKTVGDIFVPLIPGVIAAGICSGLATLLTQVSPGLAQLNSGISGGIVTTANIAAHLHGDMGLTLIYVLHQFLTMIHVAFMTYITAWAGYRAAEKFGATPILGGMLGMITTMSNINFLSPLVGMWVDEAGGANALDAVLRAGRGGVLAVILGVLLMSRVEKFVRSRMPDALDMVISPLVILTVCILPYIFIIMPWVLSVCPKTSPSAWLQASWVPFCSCRWCPWECTTVWWRCTPFRKPPWALSPSTLPWPWPEPVRWVPPSPSGSKPDAPEIGG